MTASVTIGEFSRLCHLSTKTLRYYHDIELLVPATVDGGTGYRRYSLEQVADAHLIRRLRELELPLAEIRDVLAEPDGAGREHVLAQHLARMEAELVRTREVVSSLRALLRMPRDVAVSHRITPDLPVLARAQRLARSEIADWCAATYPWLYQTLAELGLEPAGPAGATYPVDFFEHDEGRITAFVPVDHDAVPPGDSRFIVLARQRFAVALHTGPFTECDLTYGRLGGHVADHDVGLAEPIRELYLVGPDHTDDPSGFQTEICWPIDSSSSSSKE
jgi:DNA-binding transcriptional MerR regulator/effector-binding domain-containing protein